MKKLDDTEYSPYPRVQLPECHEHSPTTVANK